jgi:hypothetical protein
VSTILLAEDDPDIRFMVAFKLFSPRELLGRVEALLAARVRG